MQQPLPSLRVSCLKIFPPTTTLTEIPHPSANSSPTPAQLCRPGASQPSRGRSGLTPSLPKNNWRLANIKTVCAWRLPSKTALHPITFLRLKRSAGEEKKKREHLTHGGKVANFLCKRFNLIIPAFLRTFGTPFSGKQV